MPAVKFIKRLDSEQNISFMDRHELEDRSLQYIKHKEAVS